MTVELFHKTSNDCSKAVTINYSTSFSSAIKLLHKDLRTPIFNLYGFVRLADEIVDTFHHQNQSSLLANFEQETFAALEQGISLNPILNSFQLTVHQYKIGYDLIHAFFKSMASDLTQNRYNRQDYEEYIYGSAEVVGLMCLHIFCEGDLLRFEKLKPAAQALGAAFQKVNFLRDVRADYLSLSRIYFPHCDFHHFTENDKREIEEDIEMDFQKAYKGILQLPMKARFGVYVAYKYYYSLFKKIKSVKPQHILQTRVRIPNSHKAYIVFRASVKNSFRMI